MLVLSLSAVTSDGADHVCSWLCLMGSISCSWLDDLW